MKEIKEYILMDYLESAEPLQLIKEIEKQVLNLRLNHVNLF